ncbi:MAG: hypothetical protein BIFFINMI_02121 [Phycisphaerae bacterium]|nr:hypothetical protein [Phycisphaerae bacterium]
MTQDASQHDATGHRRRTRRGLATLLIAGPLRRRRIVAAATLAASVVAAVVAARGYRTDNSLSFWMKAGGPMAEHYQALERRYGTDDYIVAAWPVPQPDDPAELARAGRLADLLRRRPEVQQVFSPADMMEQAAIRMRLPRVVGNMVSPDGRTLAVAARLNPSQRSDFPAMLDRVQSEADAFAPPEGIHWGGPPVANAAITEASNRSLRLVLPAVALCGVAVLLVLLRSWRATAAVLLVCSAATLGAVGLQVAAGVAGNLILNIIPPLVFVLAMSLAVHVVAVMQDRGRGGRLERAARVACVRRVFWPGTLAAATTLIGTLSLALADSPPVIRFGLVAGAGIVLAWAINLLVCPSLAALLGVGGGRRRTNPRGRAGWVAPLWRLIAARPAAIVVAFALVAAAGTAALLRLHSMNDPLSYLSPRDRLHRDYRFLESRLTGMTPFVLIVTGRDEPWAALQRWLAEDRSDLVRRTELLLPRDGAAGQRAILGRIDSSRAGELDALADAARERAAALGAAAELTGAVPVILAGQEHIFRGLLRGLAATALLFAAILAVLARSVVAAVVAVLANALPVIACFGAMAALSVRLDVATAMIGSLLLGLAVDGTIHFLVRYRRRGGDRAAVRHAWRETARPMTVTALATAAAFALFAVAPFRPTALFGVFLAGGLAAAWLADLLFLPAGLLLTRRGGVA